MSRLPSRSAGWTGGTCSRRSRALIRRPRLLGQGAGVRQPFDEYPADVFCPTGDIGGRSAVAVGGVDQPDDHPLETRQT